MKRWLAAAVVTVIASSVVAGTGGATAGKPYLGSWHARMTSAQLIDAGFVDPRAVGMWRLVLNRDGTYRAFNPLDKWLSGEYSADARRINFRKDTACLAGGLKGPGFYKWSIVAGKLKLASVYAGSDPCGGRWQTLALPSWTRG